MDRSKIATIVLLCLTGLFIVGIIIVVVLDVRGPTVQRQGMTTLDVVVLDQGYGRTDAQIALIRRYVPFTRIIVLRAGTHATFESDPEVSDVLVLSIPDVLSQPLQYFARLQVENPADWFLWLGDNVLPRQKIRYCDLWFRTESHRYRRWLCSPVEYRLLLSDSNALVPTAPTVLLRYEEVHRLGNEQEWAAFCHGADVVIDNRFSDTALIIRPEMEINMTNKALFSFLVPRHVSSEDLEGLILWITQQFHTESHR